MWKEMTGLMVENEMLMNRKRTFKRAKYIIVIAEEKAGETEDSWAGRIKTLQKYMTT